MTMLHVPSMLSELDIWTTRWPLFLFYTMSEVNSDRRPFRRKRRHGGDGGGGGGGRRIPDRWLNYDPVGRDLEGTRFVAFKTPLDKSFFSGKHDLTDDDYFDVHRIVTYARQAGKIIGMVVDLTNTDRYYNKAEWADYDIKYVKMNCPGHEVSNREDIVKSFLNVVDEFISDSSNGDKLIGVHCTHGLNRTGYLICRYLIDRMGWTAELFEFSRGHPIERGHYKKSLYDAEKRIAEGSSPSSSPKQIAA
ncbi:tyrosine-protein phosphatase family protein [Ostertagia ostertagi]